MKRQLMKAGLSLALAAGVCAAAAARGNSNRQGANARHAAAVKRCKDNYEAARRAAKEKAGAEQAAALAAARRDYDDCMKAASRVH
jgi:hypothetical protein